MNTTERNNLIGALYPKLAECIRNTSSKYFAAGTTRDDKEADAIAWCVELCDIVFTTLPQVAGESPGITIKRFVFMLACQALRKGSFSNRKVGAMDVMDAHKSCSNPNAPVESETVDYRDVAYNRTRSGTDFTIADLPTMVSVELLPLAVGLSQGIRKGEVGRQLRLSKDQITRRCVALSIMLASCKRIDETSDVGFVDSVVNRFVKRPPAVLQSPINELVARGLSTDQIASVKNWTLRSVERIN